MSENETIKELYNDRITLAIRKKYRESMKEEEELTRKCEEIRGVLESEEGAALSWLEHKELEVELSENRMRLDAAKIARSVWDQARDTCIYVIEELIKEM